MMPEYYHDGENWVKECSRCRTIYIGAKTQEKAERVLFRFFSPGSDPDGFYGYCRKCGNLRYRINKARKLGLADPQELLTRQEGLCAICQVSITMHSGSDLPRAELDHDHNTGLTRGMLCSRCNKRLAALDDSEWLTKALNYLRRHDANNQDPQAGAPLAGSNVEGLDL